MPSPSTVRCLSRRLVICAAAAVAGLALSALAPALAQDAAAAKLLAPSGKLRAGLYPGTPTSILAPPQNGEAKGVGYELGRALAAKLGVPYEPIVYGKNAEVLDAVAKGEVDVVFTNATPARAKDMDFGPTYLEMELGYLVYAGSPVHTVADVDVAGRRIGVTEASTSDATLTRDLKNAQVVRAKTLQAAADLLNSKQIDAFATNKATLFELSDKVAGSTVIPGRWGAENHAIGIPKGREAGLAYLTSFTRQARASGLVQAAMDRAGLRGAVVPEN